MQDNSRDWTQLHNACQMLKILGCDSNKTCGGHIHIGVNYLGLDKKAWENFLKMWSEAEPLIYMISNRRGEKTRVGAEHYAQQASYGINRIDWDGVKIESMEDLTNLALEISGGDRYKGLNLTNVGFAEKNTTEIRLSNGTVNYNVWRENILLYGRMMQVAKQMSVVPTYKQEEYDSFFEQGLPEKEKIKRFLNLVFNSEVEKDIFYKRWESRAGEKPVFGEYSIKTYVRQRTPEIGSQKLSEIRNLSQKRPEIEEK